jgi:hypothetical protein
VTKTKGEMATQAASVKTDVEASRAELATAKTLEPEIADLKKEAWDHNFGTGDTEEAPTTP